MSVQQARARPYPARLSRSRGKGTVTMGRCAIRYYRCTRLSGWGPGSKNSTVMHTDTTRAAPHDLQNRRTSRHSGMLACNDRNVPRGPVWITMKVATSCRDTKLAIAAPSDAKPHKLSTIPQIFVHRSDFFSNTWTNLLLTSKR